MRRARPMLARSKPCIDRDHDRPKVQFFQLVRHEYRAAAFPHANLNDNARTQHRDGVGQIRVLAVPTLKVVLEQISGHA